VPDEDLRALEVELRRVVDRLDSMPLTRAAGATGPCYATASILLERTRALVSDIPATATLPSLGPQGLGSMIAVLGRDYLDAARASGRADVRPVLDALVELRRTLP
jgi:hypothetical protein